MSNQDKFDEIIQEHSNIQAFVINPDDLPLIQQFNGFSKTKKGVYNEFVDGYYKDIAIVATANLERGTVYALYKGINLLEDTHLSYVPDFKINNKDN